MLEDDYMRRIHINWRLDTNYVNTMKGFTTSEEGKILGIEECYTEQITKQGTMLMVENYDIGDLQSVR